MTQRTLSLAGGLLLFAVALNSHTTAQPSADPPASKSEQSKPRGRLPNHFGKIGVTEEQRLTIYGIQADFNAQIDELLAQVEILRGERDKTIEEVLTSAQRDLLTELRKEAARERDARRRND